MLLAKHAGDARPFRRQLSNVWRVELAAKDLLVVLVLLDDHDDVVIDRQVRRPGDAVGRERRSWQAREQSKHANCLAHARSLLPFRLVRSTTQATLMHGRKLLASLMRLLIH